VDVDETDRKALNIALNSPHLAGEYTPDTAGILADLEQKIGEAYQDLNFDALAAEFAIPSFDPVGEDEQPRLDVKKPHICPECGYEFTA